MRRIDAIGIGIGIFLAGGVAYFALQAIGLDDLSAGVWSQVLLVGGLVGWVTTYLFRVVTGNMTYNRQRDDYEEAFLERRWQELTPQQRAQLQAEIEAEAED